MAMEDKVIQREFIETKEDLARHQSLIERTEIVDIDMRISGRIKGEYRTDSQKGRLSLEFINGKQAWKYMSEILENYQGKFGSDKSFLKSGIRLTRRRSGGIETLEFTGGMGSRYSYSATNYKAKFTRYNIDD